MTPVTPGKAESHKLQLSSSKKCHRHYTHHTHTTKSELHKTNDPCKIYNGVCVLHENSALTGNLGSMSAMNEKQFGRSVLGIFGRLLLSDLAQVPNVKSAVRSRRGENGLVVRRPLHLEDLVLVRLEAVQLELEVAQVPEGDRLVRAARRQDKLRVGIEAETVNLNERNSLKKTVWDFKRLFVPRRCERRRYDWACWCCCSACPRS